MKSFDRERKIFVAGHRGMVGSAIVRALQAAGYSNLVLRPKDELDLRNQKSVNEFFSKEKPEFVFIAGGRVGGILVNSREPADFLYDNMMIVANCVHAAFEYGSEKLLYLGSACIYPRLAPQPISESALLTGPLEPTNEGYAVAKIAGLKLCEFFNRQYGRRMISAMPTNLYGIGDNFHPENSHVLPGLLRRFHEAKVKNLPEVKVWGSGKPKREFLNVDDLARALLVLMDKYEEPTTINVGYAEDQTIAELVEIVKSTVGYEGQVVYDSSKPDGMPRKLLDSTRIRALGWKPEIALRDGLKRTYAWATAADILK